MKRSVWITFAGLCILSASAWIAEPYETSPLPSLQRQGLLHAAIGLIALILSLRGRDIHPPKQSLRLALTGILFFGIPSAAIELVSTSVSSINRSALFALVPIVVILTIAAGEAKTPEDAGARNLLVPALIGLTGLFFLLPVYFSTRRLLMPAVITAAVVFAGVSSVWLYRQLQGFTQSRAIAIICLTNAAFLLACSLSAQSTWNPRDLISIASPAALIDIAEILLLLWLLRAMPPIRFAARYLLIPLLTITEGYILVRPPLTLRIAAGTILLVAGTAMLLFLNPPAEEAHLSLR